MQQLLEMIEKRATICFEEYREKNMSNIEKRQWIQEVIAALRRAKCKSTGGRERQDGWFERIRSLQSRTGSHPLARARVTKWVIPLLSGSDTAISHTRTHTRLRSNYGSAHLCQIHSVCQGFSRPHSLFAFLFLLPSHTSRCHSLPNKIESTIICAPPSLQ